MSYTNIPDAANNIEKTDSVFSKNRMGDRVHTGNEDSIIGESKLTDRSGEKQA
jgi:hypothetical protein